MSIKQQQGAEGERLACRHLERHGLTLMQRNFRCKTGEIDLIMRDGDTTVFVEVRVRNNPGFGSGADSIDWRKQRKLTRTALYYLQCNRHLDKHPTRIDVVSISDGGDGGAGHIDWIKNAIEGS